MTSKLMSTLLLFWVIVLAHANTTSYCDSESSAFPVFLESPNRAFAALGDRRILETNFNRCINVGLGVLLNMSIEEISIGSMKFIMGIAFSCHGLKLP